MKEYKVIAMSEKEFRTILEENGVKVRKYINYDKGIIDPTDEDININSIIAKHFNVDKVYVCCSDGDLEFPDEIMVMLNFNPY